MPKGRPANHKTVPDVGKNLRQQAEQLYYSRKPNSVNTQSMDKDQLIHELEVHQIELEIQNEELRHFHEELETSRNKYADLYDFAPIGYLTLDEDSNIVEANLTFCDMLGTSRSKLLKKKISGFFDRVSQDAFYLHIRQVRRGPDKNVVELNMKRPDGSFFIAQLTSTRTAENTLNIAVKDITEQKRNEKALQESEVKANALIKYAPTAIYEIDIQGTRFVSVNDVMCSMTGYTRQELMAMNPTGLLDEDSRKLFAEMVKRKLAGKKVITMADFRARKKDGTFIYVNLQATFSTQDPNTVFVIAHDITERINAEEALEQGRKKYQALVETTSDFIWEMDAQGRYTYCSPQMKRLWGYDPQGMIGKTPFEVMPPEEREGAIKAFRAFARFQRPFSGIEVKSLDSQGQMITIEISGVPFFDREGLFAGYRGVSRDITERKLIEEGFRETQELTRTGSWQFDLEKQTIEWSPEAYILYERDPSLGPPSLEEYAAYLSPEQYQILRSNMDRAVESGQTISYNLEVKLPSRKQAHYHATMHPLKNVQGKVVKLYGVIQDITEVKKTEEKLKESERKYRSLVESTSDFIWEVDKKGKCTYASPKVYDILGYKPTELIGKSPFDFMPPQEAGRVYEIFQKRISQKAPINSLEYTVNHKDGHPVILETSSVPFFDGEGHFLGYRGIDRDITKRKQAEQALKESEEKYRSLVEQSINGFAMSNSQGILIEWNASQEKITGLKRNEVVGKYAWDVNYALLPEERKTVQTVEWMKEQFGKMAQSQTLPLLNRSLEIQIQRPDGTRRTAQMTMFKVNLKNSFVIGTLIQDITERKRAEEKLRESEEKFRSLFENMTEVFSMGEIILDSQGKPFDFRYLEVNPAWEKWTHIPRVKAIGKTHREVTPNPLTKIIEAYGSVALSGIPSTFESYSPFVDNWISAYVYPLGQGKFAVIITDITARKRAEEALAKAKDELEIKVKERTVELARSEERYRSLVDNASEVILVAQNGLIQFANKMALEKTGFSQEELVGMPLLDLVHPDDREKVVRWHRSGVAGQGQSSGIEFRVMPRDGSTRWTQMSVAQITSADKPAILAICSDVTERKQREEEKEKVSNFNKILTQISSRLINTPIEKLHSEIKDAQRIICELFDFELSTVYELSRKATTTLAITSLYTRQEIPPLKAEHTAQKLFPWSERQVFSGKTVKVKSMRDLPAEAEVDRKTWDFYGIKSTLIFPLITGNAIVGSFSIDSLGRERQFSGDFVAQMQLAAQVFANAIARKQAGEALIASEKKYREVVDNASELIVVFQEGRIKFVNEKGLELTGYSRDELLALPFQDFIHPEDRAMIAERYQKRARGEDVPDSYEFRIIHKDGSTRWVFINAVLGQWQGKPATVGLVTDITERKLAEKNVASLLEFQTLLTEISNRFINVPVEKLEKEIHAAQRRLCQFLDLDFSTISQISPESEGTIRLAYVTFSKKGFPSPEKFTLGENFPWCERRLLSGQEVIISSMDNLPPEAARDQASWRHFGLKSSAIFPLIVQGNKVIGAVSFDMARKEISWPNDLIKRLKLAAQIFTNALARQRAEQIIKESEEKYRLLVDNASEVILVAQDGLIKFMSRQGLKPTGYSPEEMAEKPFLEFVYRDDRELVTEWYQRQISDKAVPSNYEFRFIAKDGSTRWAQMNAVRIDWEGKPAILAILTDITERKMMEQDLKTYARRITEVQEEERKRIAYELHDDTAQYLGIIKMQINAMLHSGKIENPEVIEKLQYLEKDADRAFNDVRRYSHELMPVVLERSGLTAALEQMTEDYNKLGQLEIEVKVGRSEPELTEDVRLGLFRIAQEALNNIRKHSKASKATITITFQETQLEMVVNDNGIGFNPDEASARARGRGSLGLISMKERASLIRADLKIESEPGKGTCIRVKVKL